MIESLLDQVAELDPHWFLLLALFLPFGETVALLDAVVPGEVGLIVLGAAAAQSDVPLMAVVAAGVAGAFLGDSTSWFIGHRWGDALLMRWEPIRTRTRQPLERATSFFDSRGGPTIFLARFVGAFRALVPLAAGTSGMPYRRFWPWNLAASVVWVTALIVLGAVFGEAVARTVDRFGVIVSVLALATVAFFVIRHLRRRARTRRHGGGRRIRTGARMKGPPPYLVRRLLIGPAFVLLPVIGLATLPLWVIVASFASRYIPGRWRPLRVAWFLFVYLTFEAILLLALFGLWVASGFGWRLRTARFRSVHYRLAGWWLRRVMGSARRTFNLRVDVENRMEDTAGRPLLVFSRHAGPGDSFLLIDALLNGAASRRPRVVLKDLLRLDPCVDVVLSRLPNRFIPSRGRAGEAVVASIEEMAGTMSEKDALVIFPEGGNFTASRWERNIRRLEEAGRPGLADRARDMRHVLPPKPTGALAAIEASGTADVVFVGHVGLEHLSTAGDLWRGIPMDAHVRSRLWVIEAEDIPPPSERERWLYDRWQEMDAWIGGHVGEPAEG